MQSKDESRRCKHRQNCVTAGNTEVNMPTSAQRSGIGKAEAHAERAEGRISRLALVWNTSCSYALSGFVRIANATLPGHKQPG
jgi:hypothetical protein